MPTNITEVEQYTANVPVADDGEDADAASILQSFQPLADRTKFLKARLPLNMIASPRELYIPGDGTVRIPPTGAILLEQASGGSILLARTTEKSITPGALASNTWHYVYAYNNSGSLDFEISTTAPNALRTTSSSDSTRRYIGCFPTNGSGQPIPLRMVGGHYVYRQSAAAADATRVANNLTSTSFADISCAAFVPPHARLAKLRVRFYVDSAGVSGYELRTKGDTTSVIASVIAGIDLYEVLEIETDSSQVIQYKVGGTGPHFYAHVYGYRD